MGGSCPRRTDGTIVVVSNKNFALQEDNGVCTSKEAIKRAGIWGGGGRWVFRPEMRLISTDGDVWRAGGLAWVLVRHGLCTWIAGRSWGKGGQETLLLIMHGGKDGGGAL